MSSVPQSDESRASEAFARFMKLRQILEEYDRARAAASPIATLDWQYIKCRLAFFELLRTTSVFQSLDMVYIEKILPPMLARVNWLAPGRTGELNAIQESLLEACTSAGINPTSRPSPDRPPPRRRTLKLGAAGNLDLNRLETKLPEEDDTLQMAMLLSASNQRNMEHGDAGDLSSSNGDSEMAVTAGSEPPKLSSVRAAVRELIRQDERPTQMAVARFMKETSGYPAVALDGSAIRRWCRAAGFGWNELVEQERRAARDS